MNKDKDKKKNEYKDENKDKKEYNDEDEDKYNNKDKDEYNDQDSNKDEEMKKVSTRRPQTVHGSRRICKNQERYLKVFRIITPLP